MRRAAVLALGTMMACIPASASAATVAEIQAQIQAILAEVAQLQAALAQNTGATVPTPQTVPVATGGACPQIGRVLRLGSSGDDVSRLQQFLAADRAVYPEAMVTGYFGALTEAAVKRWQAKYNIVSSGDAESTGYGVVGPRTAAAIALQCGGGGSALPQGTAGPTVGGFMQVTPVTGIAPLAVQVIANVNTVGSCDAATYVIDWGDGSVAQNIPVPAGTCGQLQFTYSHTYVQAGTYIVRLASGAHSTTATVAVGARQ